MFAESGVGAGIDSYYEYLMKAYILLGDNVFLDRFNIVSPPSPCIEIHIQGSGTCFFVPLLQHKWPVCSYCDNELFANIQHDAIPLSSTALQCHYEVHQSASPAAQCTHAQPHCERAQLDGLSPGILPWVTGQGSSINHICSHHTLQKGVE